MPRFYSPALPIAWVLLRLFVVLNILAGVAILVLLLAMPHEQWIMQAFRLTPSPDTSRLIMGMRWIAIAGLVAIPLNHVLLTRLLAMVRTVRVGDPFVATNAMRLQTIAWVLLGLQVIGLAIGIIGKLVSSPAHEVHLDAGFSPSGWLAVMLSFVLARVFAEGTLMRDDLDGTV